ncbi:MAG: MBL fold metallo-hydrolase [Anaerolineae bacterium]|nr:MBL fold metallo-hydrolase [Anaerolineae bacterium]
MGNMAALGIDPTTIEALAFSHIHGDHTGGLDALLAAGARPVVYLLPSFPATFKRRVQQVTRVVETSPGQEVTEGIFVTGEMGRGIREQALIVKTDLGLVIITGCAHPGVDNMVARAKELFDEPVYLVMGGFHLGSKSEREIAHIIGRFRQMGVQKVAPCHCTGDRAIRMFAAEYGDDFVPAGVGRVITIGPSGVE